MSHRERAVIYCLLAVLVAVNAVLVLGKTGSVAIASTPAPPTTNAVESVALKAAGGGADLLLRNDRGRLAWGDGPSDRAHTQAFVFIGKILRQLMDSEQFQEDRERLFTELSDKEAEYREQLEEVGTRLKDMDPSSPEALRTNEEGNEIYRKYMEWQQAALAQRGAMDAEHLERAYREMTAAVEVVASRKGVDLVYRFIPTDEPFEADNPESAMNAIRLRTALLYPKDLDITDDVMEELSLEIE
ncbi:MAG: OmpH family outer membrane protein [Planctomycetes bacterium]|nr:OmpH family outer membrane protein [Planctomycetota bacterium]